MTTSANSDLQEDDPFFRLPGDSEWNACIGRQGAEENYIDGYIEAALELATAVIEKRMYGKRDTLVMPILYTARHAVELALKFAANKLNDMGVLMRVHQKNHNILSHWDLLHSSELGDEALRECVAALKRYVISLSAIDEDGQELRYSENRDGQKSLSDRSLANIDVIRIAARELGGLITHLQNRVLDLARERTTGSYTTACSRRDLMEIAHMLPQESEWKTAAFDDAKARVLARFGLSNGKFSKAVDVIKKNREMRCIVGIHSRLAHLSDKSAVLVAREWAKLHPGPSDKSAIGIVTARQISVEAIMEHRRIAREVNEAILKSVSPDEIADMQAAFYIGRDGIFSERYEDLVDSARKEHRQEQDLATKVHHFVQKTNFLEAFARGIATLGRPDLAGELLKIRPGL
jgi:hypothetical protein